MQAHVGLRRAAEVVGRSVELATVRRATESARAGEAVCVLLVGEAGIGKTRLVAEATAVARAGGMAVCAGRSPITTPTPFSVVSDALRSWLRDHPDPAPLGPYDRGLRLVLPEWPTPDDDAALGPGEARLLAAEGVIHLLRRVVGATGGAMLVADDLHDADADSIETIRTIASAQMPGLLVLGTLRPHTSVDADRLVDALRRDAVAHVVVVEPLDAPAVAELISAVIGAVAPAPLVEDALTRTDGVPLYVEELVRGHLDAGTVSVDASGDAQWQGDGSEVPGSIRELVRTRLGPLDATEREILVAGAVIGDFSPDLMRAVAAADDAQIAAAVGAGMRVGLLEPTGRAMAFRHAIIREAVLAAAVPHLVDTMHRRAISALRGGDDAGTHERLAHHLAATGEPDASACELVLVADRRLGELALLGAERAARAAAHRAVGPDTRAAAADRLATVLAALGRWSDALDLDESTVAAHGDDPDRRLRRATCALDAGRPDAADAVLAQARAAGDSSPALSLVAGRAALVRGDGTGASRYAAEVLEDDPPDVDVRLAALDLSARAADFLGNREEACAAWTHLASEAARAGRTQARIRAVIQLGKIELFAGEPPARVLEAVELARAAGAPVELAWAQENLAIALGMRGDLAASAAVIDDAIERCRTLGLDQLAYLLSARAMTSSFVTDAVEDELSEAEAMMPTPDLRFHTASMRGEIALRAGRWEEAIEWLERSATLARSMPGVVPMTSICMLPWALAAAGRRADAAAALDEARALPDLARFHTRPVIVEAAAATLDGDGARLDRLLHDRVEAMPVDAAGMWVLGAEILGGPEAGRRLRVAYDLYVAAGATGAAEHVRRRLRASGAPVPRRPRAAAAVPAALASASVTPRELDVLRLVGEGRPNAEIAGRLFLSVRTVETHVSSLFTKLDARNRSELAVRWAEIGE